MNISVSGLTAAGKTTHARILAKQLGYDYISALEIILEKLGLEDKPEAIWSRNPDLLKAFDDATLNTYVDDRLVDTSKTRDSIVFDAWALPWLSEAQMLRLWIESDLPSRERKFIVSQKRAHEPFRDTTIVARKDSASRRNFANAYGFDIEKDHIPFDIKLVNTSLIERATIQCSNRGIALFAPVVFDAVKSWADGRPWLRHLHHREYAMFFRAKES